MMIEHLKNLKQRLEKLKADKQAGLQQLAGLRQAASQLEARLHAQDGAIQECELWLNVAKEAAGPHLAEQDDAA